MHLIKKLSAVGVALLAPAAMALAATSPTGTFKGAVHWKASPSSPAGTFDVTATFKKGVLTRLQGQGVAGTNAYVPYNTSKSTSTYCGAANSWDSKNPATTITSKKPPKGFAWEFVIKPKKTANVYGWYVVTLRGNWVSATKAKTDIRFYQQNLPDKGRCDSGQLTLTLKKS
jgi:hypothetical protein